MANEKRLIDANDAFEIVTDLAGQADTKGAYKAFWTAARAIQKMPTVDAMEVVHGRWLKLSPWNNHTQSCLCLNCDSISYQKKGGVYIGKIPNYCPNCGAKMDGDGNG